MTGSVGVKTNASVTTVENRLIKMRRFTSRRGSLPTKSKRNILPNTSLTFATVAFNKIALSFISKLSK